MILSREHNKLLPEDRHRSTSLSIIATFNPHRMECNTRRKPNAYRTTHASAVWIFQNNLISRRPNISPPYKAALPYTLPHHKPSSQSLNSSGTSSSGAKRNAESQMMAVM
jgi:hypothetical protein